MFVSIASLGSYRLGGAYLSCKVTIPYREFECVYLEIVITVSCAGKITCFSKSPFFTTPIFILKRPLYFDSSCLYDIFSIRLSKGGDGGCDVRFLTDTAGTGLGRSSA